MRLKVFGSNSRGNAYALYNDKEGLLIEAGVHLDKIKQFFNFDLKRLNGCIISHEHGDHSKYAKGLQRGMPVYMSKGTAAALKMKNAKILQHNLTQQIGNFKVKPFNLVHDAVEPLGFIISHKETGNILFITDTSEIPVSFPNGLNNIMIECNHSTTLVSEKVNRGDVTEVETIRTLRNHLSFEDCIEFFQAQNISNVNNIVLLHLSETNADRFRFRTGIKSVTNKNVYIANPDLDIDFGFAPF